MLFHDFTEYFCKVDQDFTEDVWKFYEADDEADDEIYDNLCAWFCISRNKKDK